MSKEKVCKLFERLTKGSYLYDGSQVLSLSFDKQKKVVVNFEDSQVNIKDFIFQNPPNEKDSKSNGN